MDVSGGNLNNIFYLRSPSDGNKIANLAPGKKVVVVGSSFIGTEVAAYLADKAESVTVICRMSNPLERNLGPEIGSYLKSLHESKNVRFVTNAQVTSFSSGDTDQDVAYVHVDSQEVPIAADLVVVGIGVVPSTTYLTGTSIEMNSSGNIIVNRQMQTNVPNVYAGGDIAQFPLTLPTFEDPVSVAIGHWQIAQVHGKTAGLNMDQESPFPLSTVPFFWTVQFGKSIRYAGFATHFDDILYEGDVSAGTFIAYFCHQEKVMAVATLGRDPVAAEFANSLARGTVMKKADISKA